MKNVFLILIAIILSMKATSCNSNNYIKIGFEGGGVLSPRILTALRTKEVQQNDYNFEFYVGIFSDAEKWWYDEFIPAFPDYKSIISFKVFKSTTGTETYKKFYNVDEFPNLDKYKVETEARDGWIDHFEIKYKNHIDIELQESEINLLEYKKGHIEIFFTLFNTITREDLSEQDIYTLINPKYPVFSGPRKLNFEALNNNLVSFSIKYD